MNKKQDMEKNLRNNKRYCISKEKNKAYALAVEKEKL